MTNIAFVGCGYVADLYARTLSMHPELGLAGIVDHDPKRAQRFAEHWSTRNYENLDRMLGDPAIAIVVNLTSPTAHYEISRACLEAGKHVYSEKPLALELSEARELVELAEQRGRWIVSAPCTILGEAAQTAWKVLREEQIGAIRTVYAEMDDGPVYQMPYEDWQSASGTPWPYKSEFETGCTLEHAGYHVSWLAAFFGPVRNVTAAAAVQMPEKRTELSLATNAPDFSVAIIRFACGVVARLTCSIIARRDHSMRIVGDKGVLTIADSWHSRSPVFVQRWVTLRRRTFLSPWRRHVPRVVGRGTRVRRWGAAALDFLLGVSDLAEAIATDHSPRISARFSLHVNEVVLRIHQATERGTNCEITSSFDPIAPLSWTVR